MMMLELTLKLHKYVFQGGEPVTGTLTLRNGDIQAVRVNARLAINAPYTPPEFREVELVVTDVFGRTLAFQARVNVGLPKEGDFKLLPPGKAVEAQFDLALYYVLSQPGLYKVQATYQAQQVPDVAASAVMWAGTIQSPAAQFTVQS